jgi:zinc protease
MSPLARTAPILAVLCLMSACTVMRSVPRAPAPAEVTRRELPNGVRVVIQEHRASDVAAVQLWVTVGGRDEAATELGLSHYLEHMLLKGTTSRPFGFIGREVEGAGGRMNAGTSLDYTYYHTVLPAHRAVAGLDMLADIAANASLDPGALEREKLVVLEEMRLGEDNPRRHLMRHLYGLALEGHPYGRPVIGSPGLVRALTRETLLAYYRRHYVPEAFTLVVVGAVDPRAVLAAAERTFGRLPRRGVRRLPVPAPPAAQARRVEMSRPGRQAYLGFAWLAPKIDHADTPAVDLLVRVLGHGRGSRLTRTVRDRLGLVSSIGSGYFALEGAGTVTVTAQLEPGNVGRAEAEILGEVARLREEGVSESERRRAITAAEARHEFAMETAEGRAFALGRAETVWRIEDELGYVDRLRAVSLEQIRAAARRYLDPERYTRLAFVPAAHR